MPSINNSAPFTMNNNFGSVIPPHIQASTGYTPMLLTTTPRGTQSLSTLAMPMFPVMQISREGVVIPSPSPVFPSPSPVSIPFGQPIPLVVPPVSRSASPCPPAEVYSNVPIGISGAYYSGNASRSTTPSSSMEREFVKYDSREFVKHESSEASKGAIVNVNNLPVPVFTEEMTKKELVHDTLTWMLKVFGEEHFDTDGRRGPNVLRLKVKTRGALEHICPLVDKLVNEKLVHHISCPISTKKSRQHIRGYLAYIEAVSGEAIDRIMEIFNKYNEILIHDCDGNLEHPFKGLSRNPKKARADSLSRDECHA